MESGYKARFSIIKFGTAVASYEAWILTVRAAFWSSARADSWMGMERWPCRWIPSSIATSNYERYEQLWQKYLDDYESIACIQVIDEWREEDDQSGMEY
jgi:hypothetical protein